LDNLRTVVKYASEWHETNEASVKAGLEKLREAKGLSCPDARSCSRLEDAMPSSFSRKVTSNRREV